MSDNRRRSIRLQGYDYSQPGAYFVTICVQHRACVFGSVEQDVMHLNAAGRAVLNRWEDLEGRFNSVEVDEVIVMPNHLHGILLLNAGPAELISTTHQESLGKCMQWFKSITTHDYMDGVKNREWPVFDSRLWQRNYYEHIIRNDRDLGRIRTYIEANPSQWASDNETRNGSPARCRGRPPCRPWYANTGRHGGRPLQILHYQAHTREPNPGQMHVSALDERPDLEAGGGEGAPARETGPLVAPGRHVDLPRRGDGFGWANTASEAVHRQESMRGRRRPGESRAS